MEALAFLGGMIREILKMDFIWAGTTSEETEGLGYL